MGEELFFGFYNAEYNLIDGLQESRTTPLNDIRMSEIP